MIKLLIGGSPCTHWSIAQTKNRETEPSGIGWELFENYLIALEKFKPDYFLYENNKSMSKAIREEITRRFGFEPVCINSALVSAQNRQRLYWCGKRNHDGTYSQVDVQQPADRGILLRDILETGVSFTEKGYTLKAQYYKSSPANAVDGGHFPAPMAAAPVSVDLQVVGRKKNESGEWERNWEARTDGKSSALTQVESRRMVAEPIRIGIFPNSKGELKGGQGQRIYSVEAKGINLTANGGGQGAKTGLYATPCESMAEEYYKGGFDGNLIGMIENESVCRNGNQPSQQYRIYSCDGKSVCVDTDQRKHYIVPYKKDCCEAYCLRYERTEEAKQLRKAYEAGEVKHGYHEFHELHPRLDEKTNTLTTVQKDNMIIERSDGKTTPVYEVQNGLITIKDKQYPIKLADGFYIIRKLTVTECKRLQTVPDSYVFPVSDTQAYKMLGNGWTVDVITHILSHCQGIFSESLDVLSMYDGMACGHIALDKMGAQIARYRATEIDKYAIKTACHNFPDIIQLGDAFQVREWE